MIHDELLNTHEVAALIGRRPRTLADWRRRGKGPEAFRLSRRWVFYRASAVAAWMDRWRPGWRGAPQPPYWLGWL